MVILTSSAYGIGRSLPFICSSVTVANPFGITTSSINIITLFGTEMDRPSPARKNVCHSPPRNSASAASVKSIWNPAMSNSRSGEFSPKHPDIDAENKTKMRSKLLTKSFPMMKLKPRH